MTRRRGAVALACVVLSLFARTARSQQLPPGVPIPPQNFLLPHFWGSGNPLSLDHLAMGNASVADTRDDFGANPACLTDARGPGLEATGVVTHLSQLPTITLGVYAYEQPLRRKKSNAFIKLGFVTVRGSGALTGTPLSLNTRETEPLVEFGYRAARTLSLGGGLSYLATRSDYLLPTGGVLTRLDSRPQGLGGRLGILYSPLRLVSLGASGDYYHEHLGQSFPAYPLPFPTQNYQFHSEIGRVGVGVFPDSATKLLLDYEAEKVRGAGFQTSRYAYEAGAERRLGALTLRAGLFGGDLTGGLGLTYRGVRINYAFSNQYAYLLPGEGAKTAQALELMAQF